MHIHVTSAVGIGPTKLAAFDNALVKARVANYNIIPLSSVIPAGSKVFTDPISLQENVEKWGDRLYVVMADYRIEHQNQEAWAGIGWIQEEGTGKGLFVEHAGPSETMVRRDIKASLEGLIANRKGKHTFGPMQWIVTGDVCHGEPICALAIAVFQSETWHK